jgi:hypothetical protein
MKSSQSDEKAAQPGAKNQRAQDDMKGGAKGEKSAQDNNMKGEKKGEKSAQDNNMKGEKSKSMSSENDKSKAGKDMKAEGREGRMNAEQKGAADSKSQTTTQTGQTGQTGQTTQSQTGQSGQSQTTTGQVGAGAKLSTEQRTKITTVIRNQHVEPLNNVNFEIRAGARVPRDVRFHPLPREIVTIYPEWRGYEFILVNNQIIVVNPRTLEIVDVLDA